MEPVKPLNRGFLALEAGIVVTVYARPTHIGYRSIELDGIYNFASLYAYVSLKLLELAHVKGGPGPGTKPSYLSFEDGHMVQ